MTSTTIPPVDDQMPRISGATVAALALAIVAILVAIMALGRALASPLSASLPSTGDAAVGGVATATASLTDLDITPDVVELPQTGTLRVVNDGATLHNLKIDGTDVGTADLNGGEEATLALAALSPGTYTFLCDVPGHASAGMSGTITITAADSAAPSDASAGHAMASTSDAAAMQAEMVAAMETSIGAFPAETEGVGAAVLEPTILEDGTKLFELTVDELAWEVEPGKLVDAIAYNGMVPGPTMYADIGDRIVIRVTNELDHEGTSLHPHGMKDHVFAMDGVTFISQDPIAPGDSMDYTFIASEESVVTYHSHHMSLHQVPNGLFGAMIVGDYAALAGIDGVLDEQVMVLNDAGNIGFSLNGKSFPATTPYVYSKGDRVVVHYANEGQMAHPMHLHNQRGTVIAKDGYLLPEGARYQGDTFNVAPGERLTVVYEMDNVGTWVWHCHILSHVKRSDGSMFGMLTAVIVQE